MNQKASLIILLLFWFDALFSLLLFAFHTYMYVGETGHATGHLHFLEHVGDPVTGEPIGNSVENLRSAVKGEVHVRISLDI